MVLLGTLFLLENGFAGSTSLDEFIELTGECMNRVRTGAPIEMSTATVLLAFALRSGLLLLAVSQIFLAIFEYMHPMG